MDILKEKLISNYNYKYYSVYIIIICCNTNCQTSKIKDMLGAVLLKPPLGRWGRNYH